MSTALVMAVVVYWLTQDKPVQPIQTYPKPPKRKEDGFFHSLLGLGPPDPEWKPLDPEQLDRELGVVPLRQRLRRFRCV